MYSVSTTQPPGVLGALQSRTQLLDGSQPGGYKLPVIIPPSPVQDTLPPLLSQESKPFPWIWLIIGGAAAIMLSSGKAKGHNKRGRSKPERAKNASAARTLGAMKGLSGELMNCGAWMEIENLKTGGLIWRCMGYNPAPAKSSCYTDGTGKSLKFCSKQKLVKPTSKAYKRKSIFRCAKYSQICPSRPTQSKPLEKPQPTSMHGQNIKAEIRDMAKYLAEEASVGQEEMKELGREVVSSGGIKPYRDGRGYKDELKVVPLFMRRAGGYTADVIAQELGFEDDQALLKAIEKEYPPGTKKIRQHEWRDFLSVARDDVLERYEILDEELEAQRIAAKFSGSPMQKELFPGMKRNLVMKVEDAATSDDPVTSCMERRGWKVKRMITLREAIAEKMVPDLFTGEMKKLSASEKEYQGAVQKCLEKHSGTAGLEGMPTDRIAEGVQKAVKKNNRRIVHGDTGENAFYISAGDGEVYSWRTGQTELKKNAGNASVHSHSAENWNSLMDITGHDEPPTRFSETDLRIFRNSAYRGIVDTDVLIMGDGRMLALRCDPETSKFPYLSDQAIKNGMKLPADYAIKSKYGGMGWNEAKQARQKEYLTGRGCTWEEARWRPIGASQPLLFKTVPKSKQEKLDLYARNPHYKYTKATPGAQRAKGKTSASRRSAYDLSKEFWMEFPGELYPGEPTQEELFSQEHRTRQAKTGSKKITMFMPAITPQQSLLFGGNDEAKI